MLTKSTTPLPRRTTRPRRGISIVEILVAMTLLVVVIGSLGVLSARTARRARTLDLKSARTFVLMQQSNRFSVLPYDSISYYAPRIDTVIAGRFKYARRVTYTESMTGSEYKTIKVYLIQVGDSTVTDSLTFLRAKTYAKSPLFI